MFPLIVLLGLTVCFADQNLFVAMTARSDNKVHYMCARRIRKFFMPGFPGLKHAQYKNISTAVLNANPCNFEEITNLTAELTDKAALVDTNHSCFFTEQGYFLQESGASMVLFSTDRYINVVFDARIHPVVIEGFQLLDKDFNIVKHMHQLAPFDESQIPRIDPACLLLILTALGCLIIGMWWGIHLFVISIRIMTRQTFQVQPKQVIKRSEEKVTATTNITIVGVVCLFIMVVGTVLLAYFYPVVISYIIYVCYSTAGLSSITFCIMSLMEILPRRMQSPLQLKLYKSTRRFIPTIKVNFLCAFPIAVAVLVSFYALRFTSRDAWVMQNIIGIAIALVFISNMRIQRFPIVLTIFVLFIIYDVFFVFITPYIDVFNKRPPQTTWPTFTTPSISTTNVSSNMSTESPINTTVTTTTTTTTTPRPPSTGTTRPPPSVMEYVALGLGTDGQLPIVLAFPHLVNNPDPCRALSGISILGLGDILVPGLMGMHCAMFDFVKDRRKLPIYSIVFMVAYTVGLSSTFIALRFMDKAQPALLYIVPATMVAVLFTALIKGELKDLLLGRTLKTILKCCHVESKKKKKKKNKEAVVDVNQQIEDKGVDENIP